MAMYTEQWAGDRFPDKSIWREENLIGSGVDAYIYLVTDGESRYALKYFGGEPWHGKIHDVAEMYDVAFEYGCVPRLVEYGRDYLLMTYIDGVTLSKTFSIWDQFGDDYVDPAFVLTVTASLIEAVAALHQAEIFHSDMHAKNVMVTQEGAVYIIDFFTARHVPHTDEYRTRDLYGSELLRLRSWVKWYIFKLRDVPDEEAQAAVSILERVVRYLVGDDTDGALAVLREHGIHPVSCNV
jgi:predicted Ser/Thr protein kinase